MNKKALAELSDKDLEDVAYGLRIYYFNMLQVAAFGNREYIEEAGRIKALLVRLGIDA